MTDRTPIVLTLLTDALQARAADSPDDHDLHALADGVALAVDHGAVAALWPSSGTDERIAEWCLNIVTGACDWHPGASDDARREEVAVARRLADVAASLCVRGEHMRREAEAMWRAASRLLGFEMEAGSAADRYLDNERRELLAGNERMRHEAIASRFALRQALVLPTSCGDDHATLCERVAMVVKWRDEIGHPAVAEAGRLRSDLSVARLDLASMTEQRDEALRQLADLRRDLQDAHAGRRWDLTP